mgnify:CR=1 FL=1
MDHTEQHIVAIDLGTSKIALVVVKVNGDDVQVVYHKETASAGILNRGVTNMVNASIPLQHLIKDAEESLNIKINQAVIGMPKFPIRQEANSGKIEDRGEYTEITQENVEDLKRFAQDSYPLPSNVKEAIYGAVAQSFSDGENFQIKEEDIVGMSSDVLEGHFKIFIGKRKELMNADALLAKVGISAIRKYFTADTTARVILSETEMDNGVALVDFGGGSTSVTIYHDGILRHYASIPFGGKSITHDVKSELQITERLAENIKLAFGACMPDKLQSLSEKVIQIRSNSSEGDKSLSVKYLSEIITARVEEIMMAILYEIEISGFADRLRSGIVITGGCAQMANLGNFIYDISGFRVRTGYAQNLFSHSGCEGLNETSATTSLGLLLAAKDDMGNCAHGEDTVEVVVPAADNPFDFPVETVPVTEEEAPETPVTEEEAEPQVEAEPVNEPVEEKEEEIQTTLFKDDEIEKVQVVKKPKGTKPGISVIWTTLRKLSKSVTESAGNLYENVNQGIDNENV